MTGMGTVAFIPVHIEYEVPGVDYLGFCGAADGCQPVGYGSGMRKQGSAVYRKAGVSSRNELTAWFFEDMLEPLPTGDS